MTIQSNAKLKQKAMMFQNNNNSTIDELMEIDSSAAIDKQPQKKNSLVTKSESDTDFSGNESNLMSNEKLTLKS